MNLDDDVAASLAPLVYKDVAQPAAQEVGEVLRRTVRAALSPLRASLWTIEKAEEWVEGAVAQRLSGIPPEEVDTPPAAVVVPALVSIQYVGDDTLRQMFAELIATSMVRARAGDAHPAFADAIRQLDPAEGQILHALSMIPEKMLEHVDALIVSQRSVIRGHGIKERQYSSAYRVVEAGWPSNIGLPDRSRGAIHLANLVRLELVEWWIEADAQPPASIIETTRRGESEQEKIRIINERKRISIALTPYGLQFTRACLPR